MKGKTQKHVDAPVLPAEFKLAYGPEVIRSRIAQIARQISDWGAEAEKKTGQQVLAIGVLRGGIFFYADLVRALSVSVEVSCCRTYSYSSSSNERVEGAVRVSLADIEAAGRAILIVDDICDTGATLHRLQNVFTELGATDVQTAVLIHRQVEDSKFSPTWSAFEYQGGEWFVGYGMEDRNRFANLPAVYTILAPVDQA